MSDTRLSARSFSEKAFVVFRQAAKLMVETLQEIFDELPYERFLKRQAVTRSAATYADFRAEHEKAKAFRVRCC